MKKIIASLILSAWVVTAAAAAETPPPAPPAPAAAASPGTGNDLQAQAERGDAGAQDMLALKYANEGNDKFPLALKWWRKAAEQGNLDGEYQLGQIYYQGLGGEKKDPKEACKWFEKSALQDNIVAEFYTGMCYGDGLGVEKNHENAYFWLLVAKKHGYMVSPVLLDKFSKDLTPAETGAAKARMSKWFVAHPLKE